jgi:hypothetical protein
MSTDPSEYRFSVKEPHAGGDDTPSTIVCEPLTDVPGAADCGAFALRLRPGTSAVEAHAIARYLQVHVKGFCRLED